MSEALALLNITFVLQSKLRLVLVLNNHASTVVAVPLSICIASAGSS